MELEENCAENDISIAQLLQNQKYNRRKRKEGIEELGPTLALKKTYIGLVLMKELSGEDVLVFEKLK